MKNFILIAIGILLFSLGAFFAVINYVDGSWPRVKGEVIGTRNTKGTEVPIVEYIASGTKFQVIPSDQPLIGSFQKGKKQVIAYNPDSPGEAKIADSGLMALVPWMLMTLGALLAVAGDIMRKRSQRGDTENDETSVDSEQQDNISTHQV